MPELHADDDGHLTDAERDRLLRELDDERAAQAASARRSTEAGRPSWWRRLLGRRCTKP